MNIFKTIIACALAVFCLGSCSSGASSAAELEGLLKNYGNIAFSKVEEAEKYNFAEDIFTEINERSIHSQTQTIVKGTVSAVDELQVDIQFPMDVVIPAEESATGIEETMTEYVPVTAYIQLITFKPSEVFYDETKSVESGTSFRILTRISTRMWDDTAIPLFSGDEAILYLYSAEVDGDIMEIYDRGFASFVLFDSANGVIKKTDKGWIFGKYQEYLSEGAKSYGEVFGLSEENATELYSKDPLSKCYRNESSYFDSLSSLFVIDNPDGAVKNNVRYYYEG